MASIPEAGVVPRDRVWGICLPLLPRAALEARLEVVEMKRARGKRPVAPSAAGFAAFKVSRENMTFKGYKVKVEAKGLFNGLLKRIEPATSGLDNG